MRLVVLCASLAIGSMGTASQWEIIEFFSGRGRLARLASRAGHKVAAYEINMSFDEPARKRSSRFAKRQTFDFNGECGFALLGPNPSLVALSCQVGHHPGAAGRVWKAARPLCSALQHVDQHEHGDIEEKRSLPCWG